ncbi:MAG TPA: A/G-specific adenine glycosylase [Flavobacteriaceae bacterium]|nr:A/G-specific adenine glycosylase [Flavobacteriaceae bacterium]
MNFSENLIKWYLPRKRDLPWRKTTDPYKIWLSEIMLQQTRVAQGLPYYLAFLETFPTVFDLASASEEKVLKLWQGLGYYSRARNLHFTAQYISNELSGEFPQTYKELLQLKGIGDYTAAAIASICHNEPVAVVDGNVFRVLSRIFGIETPINSSQGKKEFKALAKKVLDKKNPATHNQAIMEFGALHCKPVEPLCESCPFQNSCFAFQTRKTKDLPVKLKKTKVSTRHFNYLVFISAEKESILHQRTEKGIWRNLYEFPLIETKDEQNLKQFLKHPGMQNFDAEKIVLYNDQPVKHLLSHQKLLVKFWIVFCEKLPAVQLVKNASQVPYHELCNYPMPVLIGNYLDGLFAMEVAAF